MNNITLSIINVFTKERFTIGTSIIRVIFGIIILYNYLILYSQRHFLFTSYGYNSYSDRTLSNLSLYNLSDSLIYFDIIYNIGIVIAILYTLGIKGRISSILNFIFYYSLYVRFYHIGDGGDNLMIIALFFLIFADCTKYFSFDNKRKFKKVKSFKFSELSSILHNFSIFFIIAQVIILYMISATYQLMGDLWSSGTAIYYILQVETMSSPFFREFATNHFVYLGVLLTYLSIFVKYAFGFLIFNRRTKLAVVICICLFHIGIGISMHLYTFSLIMIAVETLLFTNDEYYSFYRRSNKISERIKSYFLNVTRRFSKGRLQNQQIMVFYDGWCRLCLTTVSKLKRWDWFELLVFVNFRESHNLHNQGLNLNALEKRMHSLNIKYNRIQNGVDSFIEISKRLIPLWICIPFLYLSKWVGIGNLAYDYIADKRNLVPTNKCNDEMCIVNNIEVDEE